MKNIFLAFLFLILNSIFVFSQSVSLDYSSEKIPIKKSQYFKVKNRELGLEKGNSMHLVKSYTDKLGMSHDRYHQYFHDLRVVGGSYVLHSKNDLVKTANGIIYDTKNASVAYEKLSKDDAMAVAKIHYKTYLETTKKVNKNFNLDFEVEKISNCYIDKNYPKSTGNLLEAYEIILETTINEQLHKRAIYLDVSSGLEIFGLNKIIEHSVPASAESNFYGKVSFIHDSISPTEFYLRDNTRGNGIIIRNFKTNNVFSNDSPNWEFDNDAERSSIDVMFGTAKYYDLLKNKFSYNSIDNHGFLLAANVNRKLYNNATWGGLVANFGSGDCNGYFPFTSLDVVGHEFTHGLTKFHSNLDYNSESGALNESISDIFGKTLEYFTFPDKFTWIIGKTITKPFTSAIRSMSDPKMLNDPSYYKGTYWSSDEFDNYGVHTNSGVFNHWYYLLVEGKKGKNEKGISYDVKAIGIEKAFDVVFMLNTQYLTETSTYEDAYNLSIELCKSVYGEQSVELNSVSEAWKAVGVSKEAFDPSYAYPKVDFEAKLNGNGSSNFKLCEDQLSNVVFTYRNLSKQVIPKSTPIKAQIIAQYFTKIDENIINIVDTLIQENVVLKRPIGLDSIISFDFVYIPKYKAIFPGIIFDQFLSFKIGNENFSKSYNHSFQIIYNDIEPKDRFKISQTNIELENKCSEFSALQNLNYSIIPKVCENKTQEFLLEVSGDLKVEEITVEGIVKSDNTIFNLYNLHTKFYVQDFGKISSIVLKLYYEFEGKKYLVKSDSLYRFLAKKLEKDDLIDFTHELDYYQSQLDIKSCPNCELSIQDEKLRIYGNNIFTINDCLPLEEFYDLTTQAPVFSYYLSTIDICANTQNFIEPHLNFDMQLSSSFNSIKDEYTHAALIVDNGSLLSKNKITSTNFVLKNYDYPLSKSEESRIYFSIFTQAGSFFLDNLKIYDNASTATHDINKNELLVSNPVNNTIDFKFKNHNSKPVFISMYNLKGEEIYTNSFDEATFKIDCQDWIDGLYIYKINQGEMVLRGKVVVMH